MYMDITFQEERETCQMTIKIQGDKNIMRIEIECPGNR